jgi:hypothetical protein
MAPPLLITLSMIGGSVALFSQYQHVGKTTPTERDNERGICFRIPAGVMGL